MHRSTVGGKRRPNKETTLEYHCFSHPPFEDNEYCLFSLKDAVFYPHYGDFETKEEQRQRCRNVHPRADLAVIPNEEWNQVLNAFILQ